MSVESYDKSISERVRDIRDSIGWNEGPDIREQVMELCREVQILAVQVDAIIGAQDKAPASLELENLLGDDARTDESKAKG